MTDETRRRGTGWADRLVEAWMRRVSARPGAALVVLAGLFVLGVLGALRLDVDADSSRMLSPDLPAQRQAHAVNAAFPDLKASLVVIVEAASGDRADLFTQDLSRRLMDQPEWVERVFAPAVDPYLAAHGFLFRDLDSVETTFSRISRSSNLIASLREDQTLDGFARSLTEAFLLAERAEIEPEALDKLFAEAASVVAASPEHGRIFGWSTVLDDETGTPPHRRLITVVPRLDNARLSPAKPALMEIRSHVDAALDALPGGDMTVSITGEPALRADEMSSVLGTLGISLGLSLLLVAVILWIGLGARRRAGLAFASLVISLVLTTGFAGFAIGTLNLVSVAFIVLMVGLGIDFAIHILAHVVEMRRSGTPAPDAVILTGRRSGTALVLSAVTTSLAFLAFMATDFDGMAQLGLIGGIGVLIAFAVAATLIPACVSIWPDLAGVEAVKTAPPPVAHNSPLPAILALTLGLASIWPATLARFDSDPMGLRNPDAPSVIAFRALAETPETSPYRASVLADSGDDAAEIAAAFENTPGIGAAVSVADLIPDQQDEKLTILDITAASIDHAVRGTPTDLLTRPDAADPVAELRNRLTGREGAAGQLARAIAAYQEGRSELTDRALEEQIFRSFPLMLSRLEAMLAADYVTLDTLPASLRDRFVSPLGTHRVEILPEEDLTDYTALRRFSDAVREINPRAAGGPVQMDAARASIEWAILLVTLLAGLATLLLAYATTRRFSDMLAILVPLILAGSITAAASVILKMPFNYANVIVLPLLIGIGVDSGIHIALRERRAPGAVFATSTPRAVLFSALTTMAAFGTLSLSEHQGTASMGVLLAVSMCAAVGCVLAVTPAMIRWFAAHAPRL